MNVSKQRLLVNLPEEIYYSFRDYLTQDDYQQLLNTSKRIFIDIRRKSIIYHLTEKYSIKYCEDENYRNQLIEKVENPFKQIRITLIYFTIKQYEKVFDLVPVSIKCTTLPIPLKSNISLRHLKEFSLYRHPWILLVYWI